MKSNLYAAAKWIGEHILVIERRDQYRNPTTKDFTDESLKATPQKSYRV